MCHLKKVMIKKAIKLISSTRRLVLLLPLLYRVPLRSRTHSFYMHIVRFIFFTAIDTHSHFCVVTYNNIRAVR